MQAASDIVYVYVARQSYRGTGNEDPCMEVNDVIHVTSEFLQRQNVIPDNPDGWICGVNIRTGQEGFFPGEFLIVALQYQPRKFHKALPLPVPDL